MSDCLVTTLKGSVNDSELLKLGELRIKRVSVGSNAGNKLRVMNLTTTPATLTIVGDGNFLSSQSGTSTGKIKELSQQNVAVDVYTSDGDYDIIVSNKYACRFNAVEKGYNITIADTYYTPINALDGDGLVGDITKGNPENITNITLSNNSPLRFTLEDVAMYHKLTILSAGGCITGGDFGSIGTLIALTSAYSQLGLLVSGSVESFVAKQRTERVAAGMSEGNSTGIQFRYLGAGGKITFNGSAITNSAFNKIAWTSNTITFSQSSDGVNWTDTTISA